MVLNKKNKITTTSGIYGMIGIDASFLENTEEPIYSPFDKNVKFDAEVVEWLVDNKLN